MYPDEQRLKQAAEAQYAAQSASNAQRNTVGMAGDCTIKLAMPTLQERLRSRLESAQRESRKRDSLEELLYLLDKNPDIARILELYETVERY